MPPSCFGDLNRARVIGPNTPGYVGCTATLNPHFIPLRLWFCALYFALRALFVPFYHLWATALAVPSELQGLGPRKGIGEKWKNGKEGREEQDHKGKAPSKRRRSHQERPIGTKKREIGKGVGT